MGSSDFLVTFIAVYGLGLSGAFRSAIAPNNTRISPFSHKKDPYVLEVSDRAEPMRASR